MGSARVAYHGRGARRGHAESFIGLLPISVALGIVFAALRYFWACNPGQPWWRKPELATDLCYWFIIPLISRYLAHRAPDHWRGAAVRHHQHGWADRVLRGWARPARRSAPVAERRRSVQETAHVGIVDARDPRRQVRRGARGQRHLSVDRHAPRASSPA